MLAMPLSKPPGHDTIDRAKVVGLSPASPATYRHPMSYRPPLACGGHCWEFSGLIRNGDFTVTCVRCFVTVPAWVLAENWWPAFAGQWCMGAVRALPPVPLETAPRVNAGSPRGAS